MVESEVESESTVKNDYYQKKIERITNDFENQNRQKNQELVDIFEEISLENNNLKKDLIMAKEDLDDEIEKNIDIKNSIYNFNYFTKNTSNDLLEKLNKNKNIKKKEDYTNSIFCDYIKAIKEEANEKLSSLNTEQENNIKNFELMKTSLENNIKNLPNMLKEQENFNKYLNEILEEININNNKYYSLLQENYANKKYIIILEEKLGLSNEEIIFLKERIIKEKKIILEKINSLSHNNKLNQINVIQELLNEIDDKRKNYFNEQFLYPLQSLHQNFLEFKEKEKEMNNKNEILKKELDELKCKYDNIIEEKNELIKNAVNYTINKENNKNNEIYYQSVINKLRKEKELLENENNSLLKNNTQLNEQIISINNKIGFEIFQNKKNCDVLINQKDNLIKELNKKLNNITEISSRDKNTIKNLNEEIESLNNKIKEYTISENNFRTEVLALKKKIIDTNNKSTNIQTNTLESLNNPQKFQTVQSEKKTIKNNLDSNYRNKNKELDSFNKESFKLTTTEKINGEIENILYIIKKIYSNHISNEIDNINEIYMLNEINSKLNQLENNYTNNNTDSEKNKFIKLKIVYNENFDNLEQNKNSQLYENILIYLYHLESQQKIEINKILSNYISPLDKKNKKFLQILDDLKTDFDEKYRKCSERIKNSVNIDELEQILAELKNVYEIVIDYIIQSFYNYKRELNGNILTIQLPLEEYDKIINNTSSNLANIDANIVNKINEYRSQSTKIESAMNILIDKVNNNLN